MRSAYQTKSEMEPLWVFSSCVQRNPLGSACGTGDISTMNASTSFGELAVSSDPQATYRLAVVEDEKDDLDRIKVELAKFSISNPDIATDYKSFRKMVDRSQYDAVSI